ncbi:MAG: holo-ACP synthase [Anaerolineae bacterium]|jgi:holo-[acyl-carrier protein] synthase|nr:holo-ACP synthase [Anaerolineae bacterium]MBT7075386.1 holo-ACP synthase [Anaerolineae bacterium]MBT7781369.1 holo-ACP synthase [Anaerolineae bacterium]
MNLSTGIDLIEIERVGSAIERHGERFLSRIYTPRELEDCAGNIESLAARFAAKEATAKALKTGFGKIAWDEVEIRRGENREPILILHNKAAAIAEKQNLRIWSVSLSHSQTHAIAMVVGTG